MTDQSESWQSSVAASHRAAVNRLLGARSPGGLWKGRLSGSALATAVAVGALSSIDARQHARLIENGCRWLFEHQNDDGGWGDSPESVSNLPTTLLCWSITDFLTGQQERRRHALARAADFIKTRAGGLDPDSLEESVIKVYGMDRTFSAPILAFAALCGKLGEGDGRWRRVPQLPVELAWCHPALFDWVGMPVVTYAVPALIAIGLLRHRRLPTAEPVWGRVRDWVTGPVLRRLENIQPTSGGFLEAVPLTGFVAMSLAGADLGCRPAVKQATRFLVDSVRPEGCWPIDSDLGVWNTTLAIKALTAGPEGLSRLDAAGLRTLLADLQFRSRHAYTRAAPGGWAWTDLPGGVPDADDTSGALVALQRLGASGPSAKQAGVGGVHWLLGLQNRDGGWPTFCKGVGRLPFDQSCADITAHALRALDLWYDDLPRMLRGRVDTAMAAGIDYLAASLHDDGYWTPLWFGSQLTADSTNPTYGTARVVQALSTMTPERLPPVDELEHAGCQWLAATQKRDGSWGADAGASATVEETALAVEALAGIDGYQSQAVRGAQWLVEATNGGQNFPASPIGLYFASLWYSEELYPLVFTTAAWGAVLRNCMPSRPGW